MRDPPSTNHQLVSRSYSGKGTVMGEALLVEVEVEVEVKVNIEVLSDQGTAPSFILSTAGRGLSGTRSDVLVLP